MAAAPVWASPAVWWRVPWPCMPCCTAVKPPPMPSAFGWWLGAFAASLLVSGGSFLALRRLPPVWTPRLALLLAVLGGALAFAPMGLPIR